MNKVKLMMSITVALILPLFAGCNKGPASEVAFNIDCCVYKFGTSKCTAKIAYNPTDQKFSRNISTADITLPNDGKLDGKTLFDVIYKDDKTVELYFGGTLEKDYKYPDTTKVFFKKSAFANATLGGNLQISLFTNQYKSTVYSGAQITLESFGGDFADELLERTIQFDNQGKYNDMFEARLNNSDKDPYTGNLTIKKAGKSSSNNNEYTLKVDDNHEVILTVLGGAIGVEANIHCNIEFATSPSDYFYFESSPSR